MLQIDPGKKLKSRVELHLHLDGSMRVTTLWELAGKKGIKIGPNGTLRDLEDAVRVRCPTTLAGFLSKWPIFHNLVAGDLEAIERVSYELCEDEAKEDVAYFEARYSPHLWSSTEGEPTTKRKVTADEVVEAVSRGLKRGQADFGVKARQILSSISGHGDWSLDILRLCSKYRDMGVVGLDVAGDDAFPGCIFGPTEVAVFKEAAKQGIHRTIHAGESGPGINVKLAIDDLNVHRIGHGYRVLDDYDLYKECTKSSVHFECCPYSSILTGAVVSTYNGGKHPIVAFAEDNVNFSISKDDTTVIGVTLDDEYRYLYNLGLTEAHIIRAVGIKSCPFIPLTINFRQNLNAARAAFLPPEEKNQLLDHLLRVYGINI